MSVNPNMFQPVPNANLHLLLCLAAPPLLLLLRQTFLCAAGPLYNNEGVLLHVGATIIWSDGRRANFQCGFDQALTQYLEVR